MYLHLPLGPPWLAATMLVLICVSSVFCYCNVGLKTDDYYFMGFPAAWNVVAVVLWLMDTGAAFTVTVTVALAVLTVAPLAFIHPFRVRRLMAYNVVATLGWTAPMPGKAWSIWASSWSADRMRQSSGAIP